MAELEITGKERQQVEGQDKTRAGRFFLPGSISMSSRIRSSFGSICRE
jgi:hypothetical protein